MQQALMKLSFKANCSSSQVTRLWVSDVKASHVSVKSRKFKPSFYTDLMKVGLLHHKSLNIVLRCSERCAIVLPSNSVLCAWAQMVQGKPRKFIIRNTSFEKSRGKIPKAFQWRPEVEWRMQTWRSDNKGWRSRRSFPDQKHWVLHFWVSFSLEALSYPNVIFFWVEVNYIKMGSRGKWLISRRSATMQFKETQCCVWALKILSLH